MAASEVNSSLENRKRPHDGGRSKFKHKRFKHAKERISPFEGTHEEILVAEAEELLQSLKLREGEASLQNESKIEANGSEEPVAPQTELELNIERISSTGDGLAVDPSRRHVYTVPFSVPGDTVKAKVFRVVKDSHYSMTDLVEVIKTSTEYRDDNLVKCPYFASCSGCQFQMMPYDLQLSHKKTVLERAFASFSSLEPSQIPAVGETIGSPQQYGYRTKLTPHFDGPPGYRGDRRHGRTPQFKEAPPIGFMKKGTRKTLDIEDCPIATDAVRNGLKEERKRVLDSIHTFRKGATLLLREHTEKSDTSKPPTDTSLGNDDQSSGISEANGTSSKQNPKTCVKDFNATTREYVDNFEFTNRAGAFFQNNNSILSDFTAYIRETIASSTANVQPPVNYLIDAYCGSGLFTITLSSSFKRSLGIDIATSSIESAQENARLNNLTSDQASFIAADAAAIFKQVKFAPDEACVILDPPRKGCSTEFLEQLLAFGPARILYVSCNVHTQARDIGLLVRGRVGAGIADGKSAKQTSPCYKLESLRGFDFFPQTGHVEGVALLTKVILNST